MSLTFGDGMRRELGRPPERRMNMATRSIALLVALVSVAAAAACGSDETGTTDTLPTPATAITEVPTIEVPDTDVPVTETPVPITSPSIDADADVQAELDNARELWATQGPDSYTIITQSLCFCPIEQWSDTIVDGVVTEHVALNDDVFSDPGARPMGVLFDMVQRASDDGYASLDVSYDPDTGALRQFFVDVDERVADEEYGVEVISLDALD